MAPKKATTDERTEPTPRVTTQRTPRMPTPMVPTPRVQEDITPNRITEPDHVHARCSPRGHRPPQVTQEKRAYQLLATPLPRINKTCAVTDVATGQQLEYRQLLQRPDLKPIWEKAFANELGRLAQGIQDVKGMNTIAFIHAAEIPKERTVTYGRLVCNIRPQKAEQHRVQLTIGGDRIDYPGETATKNVDLTTSKCLWNSTISTPNARYMYADVNNFYLNTLMDRPEYMQLALTIIPQEIIHKYKLMDKEKHGKFYIRIDKGMYGLPQASRPANNLLVKRLAPHGYRPCEHTHGLWRHDTKPVTFTLMVDDCGIKYVGKENADHLLNALKENYEVTEDWVGKSYCGISLRWD
jgi:hypothetical protein